MVTEDKPVPRPLLDVASLESALVRPGGMWSRIEVVPEVGSTNTELVVRAQQGAPTAPCSSPNTRPPAGADSAVGSARPRVLR